MTLSIVILAAGQGKRMHSALPKVLHRLAGKTLLEHVAHTAHQVNPAEPAIVIYGHQGEIVRHQLADLNVTWVEQTQQLGTGHALMQALPHIPAHHRVLVLYGDTPLISLATIKNFIAATSADALGIITANLPNPYGLGRIIRDAQNKITHIIEDKDLNDAQRGITEINTGIYLFPAQFLTKALPLLQNNNAQKEYYLTDVIKIAVDNNITIHSVQPAANHEVLGINDRLQLAQLERAYQAQMAEKLMRQGVTLLDPQRFDVRGELIAGRDVVIDINVIIEGHVTLGEGCIIGPHSILRNVILGERVEVKAHSIIDGAEIAADCVIGPFARIRPGTVLDARVHVGNFVEIKNSILGTGTKINHLSYAGDSEIGQRVNIGAGAITCNYDGANKHRTVIGNDVFVGSNTSLVAPITIGNGATIGAGSTLSRNAPAGQLTVCRAQQRSIENWQRPMKKQES